VPTDRSTLPSGAEAPLAVRHLQVEEDGAGQRLDNFLFKHLKGVPKSRVYRMLRGGELRVNGGRAGPETRLELGDTLRIPPLRLPTRSAEDSPAKIGKSLLGRIIYRDDALLVLNKPAGQAVHGGSGISLGVIEQLRRELPDQRFVELAHRLDRETSGLLLVALKRAALTGLHALLRDGGVQKTYLALAAGAWRDAVRHVRLPLHKFTTAEGERRVAVREDGQFAHTIFRLRRQYPGFSLLEAELKTGRTHQIRVHLASLNHPIALDDKYGDFELNRRLKKQGLKRMFLHAARLRLAHPLSGEILTLNAPLPADLQGFLDSLETTT